LLIYTGCVKKIPLAIAAVLAAYPPIGPQPVSQAKRKSFAISDDRGRAMNSK